MRERFIDETRHWVMRDSCGRSTAAGQAPAPGPQALFAGLWQRFDESTIESWRQPTWEAVSLHLLWRVCRRGVQGVAEQQHTAPSAVRHRDLLLRATGVDTDSLVHEVLIRFCAAYADQGLAPWPLPRRERGFFDAFATLYRQSNGPPDRWLRSLPAELSRLHRAGLDPLDSIFESLEALGVEPAQWNEYLVAALLALRGWAGMLRQMEVRPDRVALAAPGGTLLEFLAVRLILERLAVTYVARENLSYDGSLAALGDHLSARPVATSSAAAEERAFLVFQIAQVTGWSPESLSRMSEADWSSLVREIEAFSSLERRRIFHAAFERRFRTRALDSLAIAAARPSERVAAPRFQAVFCIDTREESFRRHLEELAPDAETFGVAGFFSVPMYYRGVADAHFAALCPIVIRPRHWVVEDVVYTLEDSHRRREKTRRALGNASHRLHVGSRGIGPGALLAAGLGVLASVPLVARVLFPRSTARVRRAAGQFVGPPLITRLRLERTAAEPGPAEEQIGFSLDEMTNIAERMLHDIGLTSGFGRLVMFLGHGSKCLNNPHESAYDCGACSGGAGGPNARALAAMLNDPRVRHNLAERGLDIPRETLFLGGLHNTCADSVSFFDLDLLPKSHVADFEAARQNLEAACERNAHERCRRFDSAPLDLSFAAARRHVEGRSEDLAQTRPEFGNASNAMCFVGRRQRVRGLYLDRRSFLVSYDPTQDDHEQSILTRILGAVVPVCEGINLQYFFSTIDSPGWGSGTKLPHNVTSLLGVMDGAASDLRSGLPWQGVEIHEPVRLLFVIEATPEAMTSILERQEVVGRILCHGWAQLAVLDPHGSGIHVWHADGFRPYQNETTRLPTASSSFQWYRGWREHLEFAVIEH